MRKISTKLLALVIITAAIITAATTISLSAASPAFAKIDAHCKETGTFTVCSGGESIKNCTTCEGRSDPGGGGGRIVTDETDLAVGFSGGGGHKLELESGQTLVGGGGGHFAPEGPEVGGRGEHEQGPGGNSPRFLSNGIQCQQLDF
jgi:hypothetical protein